MKNLFLKMKWISVKDELPKPYTPVLCFVPLSRDNTNNVVGGRYCEEEGWKFQNVNGYSFFNTGIVTYWAEMPEAPHEMD